jgi:putative alpha-1,2-mannosidase
MRPIIFGIVFCFALSAYSRNSKYVRVFIGTDGTGHTFPGPSMPFGLVQPGPDNRDFGWSHTSGYQYQDTFLLGFSQTRFSGTGISEMGDVLLLPIKPSTIKLKNSYVKKSEAPRGGSHTFWKDDLKAGYLLKGFVFPQNPAYFFNFH